MGKHFSPNLLSFDLGEESLRVVLPPFSRGLWTCCKSTMLTVERETERLLGQSHAAGKGFLVDTKILMSLLDPIEKEKMNG
jgi:hypothetical protein